MQSLSTKQFDLHHNSLPLSCMIRTLNEASRIGKVLDVVSRLADEIIIVDSGSTDDTVKIAESYGATVIHQPWLGNGFQKRVGEDACRNDWVLDIDADEVLSDELLASIRKVFSDGLSPVGGYLLKIAFVMPVGAPWLDFSLARRLKLYRKSVFRSPAHKAWDQPIVPETVKLPTLDGVILHHSFANLTDLHSKLNRVSTNRAVEGKPRSLNVLRLRVIFLLPLFFLKNYILRGMWRAGTYGFAFALSLAYARWLRDAKALEIAMIKECSSDHRNQIL